MENYLTTGKKEITH